MYLKDFKTWSKIKEGVEKTIIDTKSGSSFRNGEVRWANLGINIGSEIDGKGHAFTRPVIVLHLIGKNSALVVPLSTKTEKRVGYFNIIVAGEKVCYCINQIKVVSIKRLQERISKLSDNSLLEVKKNLKNFYNL